MNYKCTWCNSRIISQPIYYTQEFLKLQPGFEVYCNASCSLSAHGADSARKKSFKNSNKVKK